MSTKSGLLFEWQLIERYIELILHPLERYRLHTLDEEEEKFISLCTVVCGILLQHLVHAIHVMVLFLMMSVRTWLGDQSLGG